MCKNNFATIIQLLKKNICHFSVNQMQNIKKCIASSSIIIYAIYIHLKLCKNVKGLANVVTFFISLYIKEICLNLLLSKPE